MAEGDFTPLASDSWGRGLPGIQTLRRAESLVDGEAHEFINLEIKRFAGIFRFCLQGTVWAEVTLKDPDTLKFS